MPITLASLQAPHKALPQTLTTYDILKSIALVLMVIDHIGYYFFPDELWWRAVGRCCVPIWLFLIGYARSRDVDWRLLGGALVLVAVNAALQRTMLPLNILASIILMRLILDPLMRFIGRSDVKLAIVTTLFAVLYALTDAIWEYGTVGFIFGIAGYLVRNGFRDNPMLPPLYATIAVAIYAGTQQEVFHFEILQEIIMVSGSALAMWALLVYLPRNTDTGITLRNPVALRAVQFTGRHTLFLYVAHLIVFKLLFAQTCGCIYCCCIPHFSVLNLVS